MTAGERVKKNAVFKPRARQVKQQQYMIPTTLNRISEELLSDPVWKPVVNTNFVFTASEVEVYAVLSVAQPGDAALMLSHGVRSAEEAVAYLRSHGAEHRMAKRTVITADALKRGISSHDFMSRMRLAVIAYPNDDTDPRVMDVLELSTISSLDDQWGWVAKEVRSGAIRLEDIKYLGASKLKSFRRLICVKEALQAVHEPGAKFSMEDLKYLVDWAARDGLQSTHFNALVQYLVGEGIAGVKKLDSLKMVRLIAFRYHDELRLQRVTYEIDFRSVYERREGASFPEKELLELFDAGVPAEEAARLMNEGLSVGSVIGVAVGSVEKPLSDGWL